jgi:hypothetical protein
MSDIGTVQISESLAQAGVKRISIEAVITRADGTVEDLGVICESGPVEDCEAPPPLAA